MCRHLTELFIKELPQESAMWVVLRYETQPLHPGAMEINGDGYID
jgi:hypothetical protein